MVNYFFISETLLYLSNYQSQRRIYSIIKKKKEEDREKNKIRKNKYRERGKGKVHENNKVKYLNR